MNDQDILRRVITRARKMEDEEEARSEEEDGKEMFFSLNFS